MDFVSINNIDKRIKKKSENNIFTSENLDVIRVGKRRPMPVKLLQTITICSVCVIIPLITLLTSNHRVL